MANVAGAARLALFEFDPGWLWQGSAELQNQDSMMVVDPAERVVFEGASVPPEIEHMFARTTVRASEQPQPLLRDWQQNGAAWRAGMVRLDLQSAHLSGSPWNVVVYAPLVPAGAAARSLLGDLLAVLLLGAAAVMFATWYLSGRWQAVL